MENATRGMLGGGPTSQYPRMQSQQIRGALPRAVTPVSSRYPQLLCVLAHFRRRDALRTAKISRATNDPMGAPPVRVNDAPMTQRFPRRYRSCARHLHHFKTTARIAPAAVRVR